MLGSSRRSKLTPRSTTFSTSRSLCSRLRLCFGGSGSFGTTSPPMTAVTSRSRRLSKAGWSPLIAGSPTPLDCAAESRFSDPGTDCQAVCRGRSRGNRTVRPTRAALNMADVADVAASQLSGSAATAEFNVRIVGVWRRSPTSARGSILLVSAHLGLANTCTPHRLSVGRWMVMPPRQRWIMAMMCAVLGWP